MSRRGNLDALRARQASRRRVPAQDLVRERFELQVIEKYGFDFQRLPGETSDEYEKRVPTEALESPDGR